MNSKQKLTRKGLIPVFEQLEARQLMSAYYVDPVNGNDANTGRSAKLPWQTLAAVNAHAFRPGDKILLTGTFSAQSLVLGANALGVSVDTYTYDPATRRTKIAVQNAAALTSVPGDGVLITTSRVTVADLSITAEPAAMSSGQYSDGIHLLNSTAAPLTKETINRVTVSGFAYAGLVVQGWNTSTTDSAGFSNVLIENSSFSANGVSGIFVGTGDNTGNEFAPDFPAAFYVNSNITINHCQAFNNLGYNSALTEGYNSSNINNGNSSSGGIFVSSGKGITVENSTAYNNCINSNGGVGLWAFDATRVNFLADESYDNKTASTVDGDGFDFDHGVTNSIMQRDYSHGNDGAGFLITTFGGTSNDNGNIIRYCISDDDGQMNSNAGIVLNSKTDTPLLNEEVYNNTVLVGNAASGTPAGIVINGDASSSAVVSIYNNLLYSTGSSPLLIDDGPSAGTKIEGNDYWAAGASGNFVVEWNGTTYNALTDWRAASGQETTSIGQAVGVNVDPQFPSEVVSDLPIANIATIQLPIKSPLRKQGVDLVARAGRYVKPVANPPVAVTNLLWTGIGPRDYFNRAVNHITVGAG